MSAKTSKGTRTLKAGPISINAMSPEARELLDTAMAEWKQFRKGCLKTIAGKRVRPSIYSFAYWLIRYSGLVEPARENEDQEMSARAWTWVCEFCFRTTNEDPLPFGWDWVWQSAVCPRCKEKVAALGGYNVVKGGAFAGKRVDPRSQRQRAKQRRIRRTLQSLGRTR